MLLWCGFCFGREVIVEGMVRVEVYLYCLCVCQGWISFIVLLILGFLEIILVFVQWLLNSLMMCIWLMFLWWQCGLLVCECWIWCLCWIMFSICLIWVLLVCLIQIISVLFCFFSIWLCINMLWWNLFLFVEMIFGNVNVSVRVSVVI